MVEKIYVGILVDRVCRATEGLIDDEVSGFRSGRGCADEIFILKQIDQKAREKKMQSVCVWVS